MSRTHSIFIDNINYDDRFVFFFFHFQHFSYSVFGFIRSVEIIMGLPISLCVLDFYHKSNAHIYRPVTYIFIIYYDAPRISPLVNWPAAFEDNTVMCLFSSAAFQLYQFLFVASPSRYEHCEMWAGLLTVCSNRLWFRMMIAGWQLRI